TPPEVDSVEAEPAEPPEAEGELILQPGEVLYYVQPGDTLGGISEWAYGDWRAYTRIYDRNKERLQLDGRRLSDERMIHPGWVFVLPGPNRVIETVPASPDDPTSGGSWLIVQAGDSIISLTARVLGGTARAGELVAINVGTATT